MVVGGNFNFDCEAAKCPVAFKCWSDMHHLHHVPLSSTSDTQYTYCILPLAISPVLSFFLSDGIIDQIASLNTLDTDDNLSDHLPLCLTLGFDFTTTSPRSALSGCGGIRQI